MSAAALPFIDTNVLLYLFSADAAKADRAEQAVGAGGVIINVVAGNPQSAPAGGYVINLATANATATNPVVIRGNGNTVTAFTPPM